MTDKKRHRSLFFACATPSLRRGGGMTKIIGLTGKSGAGKGAACAIFEKHGIPTVDTDAVYHAILRGKNACTEELVAAFGEEILSPDGGVSRPALREAVFGHTDTKTRLHTLNTITHKYIMAKVHEMVHRHAEQNAPAVVIDAPQLFEAGIQDECDTVLAVCADDAVCLSRILRRDSIEEKDALRRLAAQHDDDFFASHCDAVIYNNGDLAPLERDICQFLRDFKVVM